MSLTELKKLDLKDFYILQVVSYVNYQNEIAYHNRRKQEWHTKR